MDDPILFNQFLNNVAGFQNFNSRVAILTFARTFQMIFGKIKDDYLIGV